ncbi:MAG: amidohydrolase family protein [Thermoanaerobaculia bacterium]
MTGRWLAPDLVWLDGAFASGPGVRVDAAGRIAEVGPIPPDVTPERWGKTAFLPGFVDVHSHSFQRGLRGLGDDFPAGAGSFWTWREAMYGLVESVDEATLRKIAVSTFREMRAAGITTIGEFHYLHHRDATALDFAFDSVVVEAAREAGIRLALLQCYYRAGGIGRELRGGQRRFDGGSLETFWSAAERLGAELDPARESLGVAPHSYRAVDRGELALLHAEAKSRGLVVHLHLEEQRLEIEEIESAHGSTPSELLLEDLDLGSETTLIHCTHTPADRLSEIFRRGVNVGLCPLTEGNLGDGIPALRAAQPPRHLALGSDSNLRLSMFENLRWLEYGQRLASERRGLLGERPALAALAAATTGGARSLRLPVGRIASGQWADFCAVDLGHPALAGVTVDGLPEALVFGCGDDVIVATSIGGRFLEHRERRSA